MHQCVCYCWQYWRAATAPCADVFRQLYNFSEYFDFESVVTFVLKQLQAVSVWEWAFILRPTIRFFNQNETYALTQTAALIFYNKWIAFSIQFNKNIRRFCHSFSFLWVHEHWPHFDFLSPECRKLYAHGKEGHRCCSSPFINVSMVQESEKEFNFHWNL